MGGLTTLRWRAAMLLVMASGCHDAIAPVAEVPTVRFCPTVSLPTWFAFRNEGQPWVQLPAGTTNFSFQPSDRLTIAYATTSPLGSSLSIAYVTAAELNEFQCPFPRGSRRLAGIVQNWQTADEFVALAMGPSAKTAEPENPGFSFTTLSDQPIDLVVEVASIPRRIVIRRDIMANSGTTLPPLDISSVEVKPTGQFRAWLEPADAPQVTPNYYFLTANGTAFHFVDGFTPGSLNQTVPFTMTRRGDVHAVSFASGISPAPTRYVADFFREATDRTVSLGQFLDVPAFSVAAINPYLRLRMQLSSQADYHGYAQARYSQALPTGESVSVSVLVSSGYSGAPAIWDVTIPDLTGAPGFDANWMLKTGIATNWVAEAANGRPFWKSSRPVDGQTLRRATREAMLAPM